MSKIEKTLELNITHELLTLADSFWWFLQPISLKKYWRPNWRFPLIETPKSFATGLHINLEGKKGGGYDVCIKSPPTFQGGNPRLLFMQFKAGVEKPFNSNTSSFFYGDAKNPRKHVEFDINSNTKRNQHKLLQEVAAQSGNKDAVVYVFPRIVNETQLKQNIGQLISKTSFISIADIDVKATKNGIKIDDGNPHKFRTCYNDYDKNEINLLLLLLGKMNNPGKQLGEIFAIRMYRALHSLKQVQNDNYPISKFHIMDAMIRHVLNLGSYFSISFTTIDRFIKSYSDINKRLKHLNFFDESQKTYDVEQTENKFAVEMFEDILKSLSLYFKWIDQIGYFEDSEIPIPPARYTIELQNNGIRFAVSTVGQIDNFDTEDLEEITYSLF